MKATREIEFTKGECDDILKNAIGKIAIDFFQISSPDLSLDIDVSSYYGGAIVKVVEKEKVTA